MLDDIISGTATPALYAFIQYRSQADNPIMNDALASLLLFSMAYMSVEISRSVKKIVEIAVCICPYISSKTAINCSVNDVAVRSIAEYLALSISDVAEYIATVKPDMANPKLNVTAVSLRAYPRSLRAFLDQLNQGAECIEAAMNRNANAGPIMPSIAYLSFLIFAPSICL